MYSYLDMDVMTVVFFDLVCPLAPLVTFIMQYCGPSWWRTVLWSFLMADCSECMCWSPMVADTQLVPAQADAGVLPACEVHDAEHTRVYVGSWKGSNPGGWCIY